MKRSLLIRFLEEIKSLIESTRDWRVLRMLSLSTKRSMSALSMKWSDFIRFMLRSTLTSIILNMNLTCIILKLTKEDKINKNWLIDSRHSKRKLRRKRSSMMIEKEMRTSWNMTRCGRLQVMALEIKIGTVVALIRIQEDLFLMVMMTLMLKLLTVKAKMKAAEKKVWDLMVLKKVKTNITSDTVSEFLHI